MRHDTEGQGELFLLEVRGFFLAGLAFLSESKVLSGSSVGIWDKSSFTDFLPGATSL